MSRPGARAPSNSVRDSQLPQPMKATVAFPLTAFALSFAYFCIFRHFGKIGTPPGALAWDAAWYGSIVQYGYFTDGNVTLWHNVVFFPLYPLLCRAVWRLTPLSLEAAMTLVSAVATLFAFILLYRVFVQSVPTRVARLALLLVAFDPFAVFLYGGYSESVFLFLIALLFYLLLVRRSYLTAALAVTLASAVRPYGCLLGALVVFEAAREHYRLHGLSISAASPLWKVAVVSPLFFAGLAVYTLYLDSRFQDPLAFVHDLRAWGAPSAVSVIWSQLLTFRYAFASIYYSATNAGLLSPALTGVCIFLSVPVLLVPAARRVPSSFAFFLGFMFLYIHYMTHGNPATIVNLGRHMMVVFPLQVCFALALDRIRNWILPKENGTPSYTVVRVLSYAPALATILFAAWLYARYTVMFFRGRFVS
jgi:hypothetical protein